MHKRISVVDIELDDSTGLIKKIVKLYEPKHLPVGVKIKKDIVDKAALNEWWTDRAIPSSRTRIKEAMETLNISNTTVLLTKCYGLNLSDQYWICPKEENSLEENITWDEINFFDNPFSEDIGEVLLGINSKSSDFDFNSPDNTTDGNLIKRWKVINGKRCLIKGGANPFKQQTFNEVIATKIMERLEISHIPYTIMWEGDEPYSVCEDLVTADIELIPAWRIWQTKKKPNSVSVYQHFLNCCEDLGIKDVVPFLDRMIVIDYIIANEDRHFNNFGALRNAETLEWIGMAPIYDSGTSFGYDKNSTQIYMERDVVCKPFKNSHKEQLKLVSLYSWIDFSKLSDIRELVFDIFSETGAVGYIDETRVKAICDTTQRRIRELNEISKKTIIQDTLSTKGDVKENLAKAYEM